MAEHRQNGEGMSQMVLALEATYDVRSTNETRQSAFQFLENAKKQSDAPQHGFTLANDPNQQPAVRHFGLSLLEYALRYRWDDYNQEQADALRGWVLALARDVSESDPIYFRNKVALLWIETAKRCWGAEWMDMDDMLVALWETADTTKQSVYKQLVLYILEILSEDICNREDSVAALRQEALGQALNEIMIPPALYQDHLSTRGSSQNVRHTQNGWLARMSEFVSACCGPVAQGDQRVVGLAIKALEALKPTTVWISLQGLLEANTIQSLLSMLATGSVLAQTASIEVLQSILQRPYNAHFHEKWSSIMELCLQRDHIDLLHKLFMSCETSADDIDEAKYTLQKKLTEVVSILGDAVAQTPAVIKGHDAINALFDLLAVAFQSQSLVVSIPALHSFTKLLVTKNGDLSSAVGTRVALLLGICSERLLRYESLFEDSELPVVAYLQEDFETLPELHAFLGNYRRYCIRIIEGIACAMPREAGTYILQQTSQLVHSVSREFVPPFSNPTSSKPPLPVLQLESQASVLRSTLNGFGQWLFELSDKDDRAANDPQSAARAAYKDISSTLYEFCLKVMSAQPQHPDIARIAIHMVVNTLCKALYKGQPDLVLKVLDYTMGLSVPSIPEDSAYSDALKSFEGARLGEMQRIAFSFADGLLELLPDLETHVDGLIQSNPQDDRLRWGLQAFIFIIIHRASAGTPSARASQLQTIVQPVLQVWQDPGLTEALSTFPGFCRLMGLEGLPQYLSSRNYASTSDWSSTPLDEEGKQIKAEIQARLARLPLSATKSLLGATTERLKDGTPEYEIGSQIWGVAMQAVLPNLLQLTRHATAYPEPSNWTSLPSELQGVLQKMLVDRFWQSGISNESKDEFYARISETGSTYEGFGSTVRGMPRSIRDWCYHIIFGMTRFEEQFFGLQELAVPLAEALLANATALSAHHLQRLISLVERLVQRCPPHHRQNFLPPLLKLFFNQVDAKISAEWESIEKARLQTTEDDDLSDEMKAESILRATTYAVVSFATTLLDLKTEAPLAETSRANLALPRNSLRRLVLSEPTILEPLILFCTHTLRTQDTRCCTLICRALRSMIPVFNTSDDPATATIAPQIREFISTEVLKACITSLNEPYFVDVQRDLATLIANILAAYTPKTHTPRAVLLSLPEMGAQRVDHALEKIVGTSSERQQRGVVLGLLEGVRGRSIQEAGRIDVGGGRRERPKKKKEGFVAGLMEGAGGGEGMEVRREGVQRGGSPGLEGMAGMFGDA